MKRIKTALALVLTLALAMGVVPLPTAEAATISNSFTIPHSDPARINIVVRFNESEGGPLASGATVICIIDVGDLDGPQNGLNAAIIGQQSGDKGETVTLDDGEERLEFTFDLRRPVMGAEWYPYVTVQDANVTENWVPTWKYVGYDYNVDPAPPEWEPNIVRPGDDVIGTPKISAAGSSPTVLPSVAPWILDVTNEKLIHNEELIHNEKLISGDDPYKYEIAGYSVNGGKRWKPGAPPDYVLAKLFKSGGSLVLADKVEKTRSISSSVIPITGSAEEPGAVLLTFPKLNRAPKAPMLRVVYDLLDDPTGEYTGSWTLVDRGAPGVEAAAVRGDLRVAWSKDGKTPIMVGKKYIQAGDGDKNYIHDTRTGCTYGIFGAEDTAKMSRGIIIAPDQGPKNKRQIYLLKMVAKEETNGTITPASRIRRIKVLNQRAAPKVKPHYKAETLKLKVGMSAYFGDGERNASLDPDDFAQKTSNGLLAEAGKSLVNLSKDDAALPVLLTDYLEEEETTLAVWLTATKSKPSSAKQVITLAPRAVLPCGALGTAGAKIKDNKNLVVYDSAKDKYGTSPKYISSAAGKIRLKNTAKPDKNNGYTGLAASRAGKLTVACGQLPAKGKQKPKTGILSATVAPPAEYAPYLIRIEDGDRTFDEDTLPELYFDVEVGESVDFECTINGIPDSLTVSLPEFNGTDKINVTIVSADLAELDAFRVTVTATLTDDTAKLYAPASKLTATLNVVKIPDEPEPPEPSEEPSTSPLPEPLD